MKYIHFITKAFSKIPPKMSFDGFSKDFAEVCQQFVAYLVTWSTI
jgi:hypothetical protein